MNRRALIIILAIVAMLVALILPRLRPTANAANSIRAAYHRAEQPVLRPGSGLPEVDQFARDLRAIDLTGAPRDVRDAMDAMIAVVEHNAIVRRSGGATNEANDLVACRKRDLLRALDRWRGQPY